MAMVKENRSNNEGEKESKKEGNERERKGKKEGEGED
jgi:hypothetical protein